MDNSVIERLADESTNLDLHVQLCEQRYLQLINKLDTVDTRLDLMSELLDEIKEKLENQESNQLRILLGASGTLILAMAGWIVHLLMK